MTPAVIQRWIDIVEGGGDGAIEDLLADDAVFYSPAVFTPQRGRELAAKYLRAASKLFGGTDFEYVGQWFGDNSAVLEFVCDIDGTHVNGIDMITWNEDDLVTEVKVMLRPMRALQTVVPKMAELLG